MEKSEVWLLAAHKILTGLYGFIILSVFLRLNQSSEKTSRFFTRQPINLDPDVFFEDPDPQKN